MTSLNWLSLSGNNLTGEIPSELGNLSSLQVLALGDNNLSGPIPASLGDLSNLINPIPFIGFYLANNNLSGCIPVNVQNLCSHVIGDISGNPNLATQSWSDFCDLNEGICCGTVPADKAALKALWASTNGPEWSIVWDTSTCNICQWPGVICNGSDRVLSLDLSNGNLNGPLPANLNLPFLEYLYLQQNQLSGALPSLSNMGNLRWLWLFENNFSGNIPNYSHPNLQYLAIGGNSGLNGGIPNFNLPNLFDFTCTSTGISGTIPNFTGLPKLERLTIHENNLSGNIPNFTSVPLLRYLALFGNQLNGSIPAFNLPNLQTLWLSNNNLSGNLPTINAPNLNYYNVANNNLSGCFPASYSAYCGISYNFSNNPLLPWEGDFSQFCASQPQIGAPCNNDMTAGPDEIQPNCSCDQSCPAYTATLSGTATICNGNSADITFNFSGGTEPYNVNWTGGSLPGIFNGHQESVSPGSTTTYTISSATDADGCPATPGGPVTITVINTINLGPVTGSSNVCTTQSTNYSVSPAGGVTSYNWTVPPGATVTAGQGTANITVNWNGASSGDVCVEAENACGTGTPSCRAVTVTPPPGQPDPISGPEEACAGDQFGYSIADVPDAASYNWTAPPNATLLSGQGTTSVVIRWNAAGTGNVCVRAQNSCGNSAYTCLSVTTVAVPANPVFLPGNFAPCENTTLNYGVTPQAAFNDYQWSYDNGGNIVSGQGTPNIAMDWAGAGDGQLCVTASSALCNVDRTSCRSAVIKLLPPAPEYISADDVLCVGDTGTYQIDPISGVTAYNWVASGGQIITMPPTAGTIKIKWPDPVFTTMEVSATNACGTGPVTYAPTVLVSEAPATPGAIGGPATVCQGSVQSYSIAPVPGADNYVWTAPAGASIQSGQGTVSVTVLFSSLGTGNLCVRAKKGFCESPPACRNISVQASGGAPGPVDGPALVCQGSTVAYSVAPVAGAIGYAWTLPPGAAITAGNNTPSVTVSFAGASSGQVCVSAVSGCGNSTASCKAVAVGASLTPSISGATSFCTGSSTVLDAGAGYTSYLWSNNQTTQTITVNSGGVYTVTVTAGGTCSGTASVTVTEGAALNPQISGPAAVCNGGIIVLDAGSGYTAYQWSNSQTTRTITVSAGATYTVTVSSASGCTGTDTHVVSAVAPPAPAIVAPASFCLGGNAVLDAGPGYAGGYQWSNSATTQSITVNTQGVYTVTVTDANGCTGTDEHAVTVETDLPACVGSLSVPAHQAANIQVTTAISWPAATGCLSGYRLSLGTSPGGSDILNNQDIGNATSYQPAQSLPADDTVFVRIVPYNGAGNAGGCPEFWFVTTSMPPCDAKSDSTELVKFYDATGGMNWTNQWVLTAPVNTWHGVTVNGEGCVTSLALENNNLAGNIPDVKLLHLEYLSCYSNQLNGNIPDFSNMPALQYFNCYDNQLNGSVPNFAKLPKLQYFSCGANLLTGNIPDFSNLPVLDYFDCSINQLSSDIPDFSNLPKLYYFNCDSNQLNGRIPNLSKTPDLQYFSCNINQLSDSIPNFLNLPALEYFSCGNNQLTGNIPDFSNLPVLKYFYCSGNQLSGSVPLFANLPGLEFISFFNNRFTFGGFLFSKPATETLIASNCGPNDFCGYHYAPQDSVFHDTLLIRQPGADLDFSLDFDENEAGNVYKWYKDSVYQPAYDKTGNNDLEISNLQSTHEGEWRVQVTNPAAPALTLYSRAIRLQVGCTVATPPDLGGDFTLCTGASRTLDAGPAAGWLWSDGSSQQTLTVSAAGAYTVTVTDAGGCTGTAGVTVTIDNQGIDCGMVAHYRLDGDAQDAGSNGLNGQNFGATPDRDRFGNCNGAMYFNSSYIGVPHDDRLNFTGDFSLSFWFKKEGSTFGHILGKGRDSENSYYFTANNGPNQDFDAFSVFNAPQSSVLSITPAEAQKWHHAASIYDKAGKMLYVYVDGALAASEMVVGSDFIFNNVHPLVLGRHCTNANGCGTFPYFFNGWIDDVRLYARALDAADVTELYNLPDDNPNPAPPAALSAAKTNLCPGETVTLSAEPVQAGYTYAWYRDGNVVAGASGATYAAQQAGEYRVLVGDASGCDSLSAALILSAAPAVTAAIATPDGTVVRCNQPSLALQASGGDVFAWSGNLGANASAIVTAAGAYTVTVTNSATGCSDTAMATVSQNTNLPNVSAAGGSLTCAQPVLLLSGNSSTPGATYAWSGPNGFTFNGPNPPVNVAGTYTLTVSNPSNGCTASATALVAADNALPPANITAPVGTQITCTTSAVTLQAPAGYLYAWSGGLGNGASTNATQAGAYTVTVTNTGNSCSATGSVTVTQNNAAPNVSASGGQLTCTQPFVILNGASGTPGVSFAWTGPNGFAAGQATPPVNVAGNYFLTVTNPQNGCTASATASVTLNNAVPAVSLATPNGTTVTCAQPFVTLNAFAAGPVSYAWTGPNGFASANPGLFVNTGGAYTVTVTNTTNNCTATASASVTLDNTPPAAVINLPNGSHLTCSTPQAVLEVIGGDTQQWSGPNGFTFNGPSPSVSQPGFYTVTVTNTANSCTAAIVVTVTQNKIPPNAQATDGAITCIQSAVTLQGISSTPDVTWSWNGPGGFTSVLQNPPVSNPGVYVLTVTNPQNGCTATATALVQQNQTPPVVSVSLPQGAQLTCDKLAIPVRASTPGSSDYVWSGPMGFSFNGPEPAISEPGLYTVVVTSLASGCTATATTTISENKELPIATITTPNGLSVTCLQSFVPLNGSGGGTYAWTGPSGFQFSGPNATVNVAGAYTLTVRDPLNGCTATATATVTEDKTPPQAAVSPATVQINCWQPAAVLQGSGGGTYAWTGPNGFASNLPNPAASAAGIYLLTVTGAVNGCTATASATVTEDKTLPGINAAGGQLDCQTLTTILLGGSGTPGAILNWTGPGGFAFSGTNPVVNLAGTYTLTVTHPESGCTAAKDVVVDPPLTLTPGVSGGDKLCPNGILTLTAAPGFAKYQWSTDTITPDLTVSQVGTYTVTVTDANQCTGTESVTVTLAQPPNPAIGVPPILCSGSTATLDAGDGYDKYKWSGGAETQTITVDKAGLYSVTVTDINGCTGTASALLNVVTSPAPGAGSNSPLCTGEQLKLFAGSGPGWQYAWTGPDGFNSDLQNPLRNNATAAMSGQYQIVVTDSNNCTGSTAVEVQVAGEILTEIDTVVCAGNTILDGKPATRDTTIQRALTSAAGCDSLIVTTIQVIDESDLQAVADTAVLLPDQTTIEVTLTDNDWLQTNWNFEIVPTPDLKGDVQVLDDGEIRYRRAQGSPYSTDVFRYRICSADVCQELCDTAEVTVLVFNKTIVPNGFVPEGEKENQLFDPLAGLNEAAAPGTQVLPDDVTILVFNRWGEIVYEANPYVPWDGRQNNRILPQGTYYYRLLLKQGDEKGVWSEGPVHLLR